MTISPESIPGAENHPPRTVTEYHDLGSLLGNLHPSALAGVIAILKARRENSAALSPNIVAAMQTVQARNEASGTPNTIDALAEQVLADYISHPEEDRRTSVSGADASVPPPAA